MTLSTALPHDQVRERIRASIGWTGGKAGQRPLLLGTLNGDELAVRAFPLFAAPYQPTLIGRIDDGPDGRVVVHGRFGVFALPHVAFSIVYLAFARTLPDPKTGNLFIVFYAVLCGLSVVGLLRLRRRLLRVLSRILAR